MRIRKLDASIAAASRQDYGEVIALLEAASLPTQDLERSSMEHFLVAREGSGKAVGAIGFERYGSAALLRSLVVSTENRDRRIGTKLVAELEARCRSLALSELFLLTTTAADFSSGRAIKQSAASLSRWLCLAPRNLPVCVQRLFA